MSKSRQNSNVPNRLSVADRTELLTKTGTREGEVILQRDIGLLYAWTDTQGTDNGGTILNVGTGSWLAQYEGAVNVKWFGATGDGVTSDTTAAVNAYTYTVSTGEALFFPAGTYKGKFTFNGASKVFGEGVKQTIFLQEDTASWTVRLYGAGVDGFAASLSDCSITAGGSGLGTGLELGDASGAGFSNGNVSRLEIDGFLNNWNISSAIMCSFKDIWSFGAADHALIVGSEKNVTTCHFNTIRLYSSKVGAYLQSVTTSTFTNCNFESNTDTGLKLFTGINSGPSYLSFIGCWLEDNGANTLIDPSLRAALYLDIQSSVASTKAQSINFTECVFSSPSGAYDISAVRSSLVTIDKCAFSATDGLTSTKLSYNTGTNSVNINLIDCGKIQSKPTEAMYASFPAFTEVSGQRYGFFYSFETTGGEIYTNNIDTGLVKDTNATLTDFDINGVKTIVIDTSVGDVTVNSFINGKNGQVLRLIKTSSLNNILVSHNGTGTEKIFTKTSGGLTISGRSGVTLVHYNNIWYQSEA